jgi:hypothetical protein
MTKEIRRMNDERNPDDMERSPSSFEFPSRVPLLACPAVRYLNGRQQVGPSPLPSQNLPKTAPIIFFPNLLFRNALRGNPK